MVLLEPLSENDLETFQRFAEVFGFAYGRFLELQEKEERNRQLQIENALERVRSRALGMQESAELMDTAAVVFEQMQVLGIPAQRCGIGIVDKEKTLFICHDQKMRRFMG